MRAPVVVVGSGVVVVVSIATVVVGAATVVVVGASVVAVLGAGSAAAVVGVDVVSVPPQAETTTTDARPAMSCRFIVTPRILTTNRPRSRSEMDTLPVRSP